jgi:uncharacterized membrane protein
VSTYQWLIALHVTGAFLLLGGSVVAVTFRALAQRSARPSEVALFMALVRYSLPLIGLGALLTLVIGLWLVHQAHYAYTDAWVVASVVLWAAGNALGGAGGKNERETRELAERLAAGGDRPSAELDALVGDRRATMLYAGSGLALLAVLVLMIWKPGA